MPPIENQRKVPLLSRKEKYYVEYGIIFRRISNSFSSFHNYIFNSKTKDKFSKESLEPMFIENPDLPQGIYKFMKKNAGPKKKVDYDVFETSCIKFPNFLNPW